MKKRNHRYETAVCGPRNGSASAGAGLCRFLVALSILVFLFALMTPASSHAQEKEPLEAPSTVRFDSLYTGNDTDGLDLLGNLPAMKLTMGSFSGETSSDFQLTNLTTQYSNGEVFVGNFHGTLKVSGTYKDGNLSGEWSFQSDLTSGRENVRDGYVPTKYRASGTFASKGLVTSTSATVEFTGKVVEYTDFYWNGSITESDTPDESAAGGSTTATFEASGGGQGGQGEGDSGGGTGGKEGGGTGGALPGLGPLGKIPGPANWWEAMTGILAPGIISIIIGLIAGLGGAPEPGPPPEEPEPDDSDRKEPGSDKPKKDKEKERKRRRARRRRAAVAGLDAATGHARKTLDMLDKHARRHGNRKLEALVNQARKEAFGPDGNVDPQKWAAVQKELRKEIAAKAGKPGSTSMEAANIRAAAKTTADVLSKTKQGVTGFFSGMGHMILAPFRGAKGIYYGIKNFKDFKRGLDDSINKWSDRNLTTEKQEFRKAFDNKDFLGGLKVMVASSMKGAGAILGSLFQKAKGAGKDILPVDEVHSWFDKNASTEEKLWSIPSAATKMAGIALILDSLGINVSTTRVPFTGTRTFIPSAGTAAGEGAAVEGAAEAGASAATETEGAAAGQAARAGQAAEGAAAEGAEIPAAEGAAEGAAEAGTAESEAAASAGKPKAGAASSETEAGATRGKTQPEAAEAGAEARAAEAEKSAARRAEQAKGDAARARDEQRFNDPEQRQSYESDYKKYMDDAQKKADDITSTVESGKEPSVDQALDNMSDPAAMRKLKNAPENVRKSFIETQKKILEPTNQDVESFLGKKHPGEEFRVESVRTPGKKYDPAGINTDNDIHALRKVTHSDGSVSWEEVPKSEWEQTYHDSFAEHSGFSVEKAKQRFSDVDWDSMTPQQQTRKWGELHQQEPGDVYQPTAGRDFKQGGSGAGEVGGDSTHAAAKKGEGRLGDAEQLGMMEKEKFTSQWNKGTISDQKEALEQLSKQGRETEALIKGYQKNYQVSDLSPKMKQALKVIGDNDLSPLERAARVRQLGFKGGPAQVSELLGKKIESLKIAKPK